MEQEKKQEVVMGKVVMMNMIPHELQNPVHNFQLRFKDLENGFKLWLSKQSLAVEAAVVTATSAAQGAAIGAFMATLSPDASSLPNAPSQPSLYPQAQVFILSFIFF